MGALLIVTCIVAFLAYCTWKKGRTGKPRAPGGNESAASSLIPHGSAKGCYDRRSRRPDPQATATTRTIPMDTERKATIRALKSHLLPAEILAEPLAQGYATMEDALRRRYPLIPFHFPPMEQQIDDYAAAGEYLSRSGLIPSHETLTPQQILRGLLSGFRDSALDSYFAHRPDFSSHAPIPKGVGTSSFWLREGNNRMTEPGIGVPPDWAERKWVVYCRDQRCCRYCGRALTVDEFHVHHIPEKTMAGNHQLDNLVTLCSSCHSLMPGHTMDLIKPRSRSRKGRRIPAARVKKREIEEWTQGILHKTVRSLAVQHKLPVPKKRQEPNSYLR